MNIKTVSGPSQVPNTGFSIVSVDPRGRVVGAASTPLEPTPIIEALATVAEDHAHHALDLWPQDHRNGLALAALTAIGHTGVSLMAMTFRLPHPSTTERADGSASLAWVEILIAAVDDFPEPIPVLLSPLRHTEMDIDFIYSPAVASILAHVACFVEANRLSYPNDSYPRLDA